VHPPRRLSKEFNSTVFKDCLQHNYHIAETRPEPPRSPAVFTATRRRNLRTLPPRL